MKKQEGKVGKTKVVNLLTKFSSRSIFPGEWEGVVPGSGFDFLDIRPYRVGDDLRRLHTRSQAQEGTKMIVDRRAQTQVSVYIYADFSRSMQKNEDLHFFSKAEIRDVLIGLACFSAAKVYSPLSLCAFTDRVEHTFPPVMGDDNAERIFHWALEREGSYDRTDIKAILEHMLRFVKPRSIVFLISDFLGELDFLEELQKAARSFDLIACVVQSEQEKRMLTTSETMRFTLKDAESGRVSEERLGEGKRIQMREAWGRHYGRLEEMLRSARTERIIADSSEVCFPRLQSIFARRRRR